MRTIEVRPPCTIAAQRSPSASTSEPESQPWLKKSSVGRPANGCRVCYVGMRIDPTTNPRGQKDAQATNESKGVLKPMGARSTFFAGGTPSPYPSTLMASQSPLSTWAPSCTITWSPAHARAATGRWGRQRGSTPSMKRIYPCDVDIARNCVAP